MDFSSEIQEIENLGDSHFDSSIGSRLSDSPTYNSNDPEDDPNYQKHQLQDKNKQQGNKKSRKKLQQKEVVYVPIVGDPNKQQKGETPNTDPWNWRKYGQKPIKGSPYPRGYYRCSSSKGCSARKQVERSRKDPSKLVITYTSEHNHPLVTNKNTKGSNNVVKNNVPLNVDTNLKGNVNIDADSLKERSTSGNKIDAHHVTSNDTNGSRPYNVYFPDMINGSSSRITTNQNPYHGLEEIDDNRLVGVSSSFVQVDDLKLLDTTNWEKEDENRHVSNERLSCFSNELDENEDDCFSNLGMLPELESIFNKRDVNNNNERIGFEDINFNHSDGTFF